MALVTATLREDFNSGIIGQSITTENTNLTFVTPGCFFGDGYAGTTGMEGYADLTEVNGFAGFAAGARKFRLQAHLRRRVQLPGEQRRRPGARRLVRCRGKRTATRSPSIQRPLHGRRPGRNKYPRTRHHPPGLYHSVIDETGQFFHWVAGTEVFGHWLSFSSTFDGTTISDVTYRNLDTGAVLATFPDVPAAPAIVDNYPIMWGAQAGQGGLRESIGFPWRLWISNRIDNVQLGADPTEIPPVRQYPRTDGRGHSSARRLVGGVPRNRLVGGHP